MAWWALLSSIVIALPTKASRRYHTLFLKVEGTVWATWWNKWVQLGDGSFTSRGSPVQVLLQLQKKTAPRHVARGETRSIAERTVNKTGLSWTMRWIQLAPQALAPDEELLERLCKDHGENAIVSVRYFIHNEADGTERAQPWNKNKSRAEAMLRRMNSFLP